MATTVFWDACRGTVAMEPGLVLCSSLLPLQPGKGQNVEVKRITSPLKLMVSGYLSKHRKRRMNQPLKT
jgi:hypothetical protein